MLANLPPDIMREISKYLEGFEIALLWCCGSSHLHHLLGIRGGVTCMNLMNPNSMEIDLWPRMLSHLVGLRELRLGGRFSAQAEAQAVCDCLKTMKELRVLHMEGQICSFILAQLANGPEKECLAEICPSLQELCISPLYRRLHPQDLPKTLNSLSVTPSKAFPTIADLDELSNGPLFWTEVLPVLHTLNLHYYSSDPAPDIILLSLIPQLRTITDLTLVTPSIPSISLLPPSLATLNLHIYDKILFDLSLPFPHNLTSLSLYSIDLVITSDFALSLPFLVSFSCSSNFGISISPDRPSSVFPMTLKSLGIYSKLNADLARLILPPKLTSLKLLGCPVAVANMETELAPGSVVKCLPQGLQTVHFRALSPSESSQASLESVLPDSVTYLSLRVMGTLPSEKGTFHFNQGSVVLGGHFPTTDGDVKNLQSSNTVSIGISKDQISKNQIFGKRLVSLEMLNLHNAPSVALYRGLTNLNLTLNTSLSEEWFKELPTLLELRLSCESIVSSSSSNRSSGSSSNGSSSSGSISKTGRREESFFFGLPTSLTVLRLKLETRRTKELMTERHFQHLAKMRDLSFLVLNDVFVAVQAHESNFQLLSCRLKNVSITLHGKRDSWRELAKPFLPKVPLKNILLSVPQLPSQS
jgi:hypothetical protein